jgi:KaiC/GvpD/RAD55 family RecA-like ATPase
MTKREYVRMESSVKNIRRPDELIEMYNKEPKPVYYWRGVEDISFGYVFGPSKVGKTIFCENLAMSLAVGRNKFFNSDMIGKPKKVFLAAFEEDYRNRTRRMQKQMGDLTKREVKLFNENMIIAGKYFPRFLTSKSQWRDFEELVKEEKPDVIIIDSLTRIVNADITNREVCKEVMARLRNFAYDNGLCLIVIHHATKIAGKPLTMDTMAGSSVMNQEADFSIGLNRNEMTNERYIKEVFYRYTDPNDLVNAFTICNDTNWLIPKDFVHESKIVFNTGENSSSNYDLLINYIEDRAEEIYTEDAAVVSYVIKAAELKAEFVETGTMPARTFDYTLQKVVKNHVLVPHGAKGNYLYNYNSAQESQLTQH